MGTTSERVGAVGGNMGSPFDDGVFDGVRKIIVGRDWDCVSYIKIEYENNEGKFEIREHGTVRGALQEVIDRSWLCYSSICSYYTFIVLYICCF